MSVDGQSNTSGLLFRCIRVNSGGEGLVVLEKGEKVVVAVGGKIRRVEV